MSNKHDHAAYWCRLVNTLRIMANMSFARFRCKFFPIHSSSSHVPFYYHTIPSSASHSPPQPLTFHSSTITLSPNNSTFQKFILFLVYQFLFLPVLYLSFSFSSLNCPPTINSLHLALCSDFVVGIFFSSLAWFRSKKWDCEGNRFVYQRSFLLRH